MADNTALVTIEQSNFMAQLGLGEEQRTSLVNLTKEVALLEAYRGQNALMLGTTLKKVKDLLGSHNGVWHKWCDNFVYSKDYANRLIQVSEMFSGVDGIENLSIRHLREIARFGDNEGDRDKLIAVVKQHSLDVHETRTLVSTVNRAEATLDQLVAGNPNLKKDLDQRLRDAKREGKDKVTTLENELREGREKNEELQDALETKEDQVEELAKRVRTDIAAEKLGEGDPEVGHLKIALQQKEWENKNLTMALGEVQKKLGKKHNEETSALDVKKLVDEIESFFGKTLAPATFGMRVKTLPEGDQREALINTLDFMQTWVDEARGLLAAD